MAKQIKVPICNKRLQGVRVVSSQSSNSGVTVSRDEDRNVTVIKLGITKNPVKKPAQVRISISKGDHYHCEDDEYFWWEREIDHWDAAREKNVLEKYPTLHMINPDTCQWMESQVRLYGPPRCGDVRDASHGVKYLSYDAGSGEHAMMGIKYSVQVPQNNIVPGMELVLWHTFLDGRTTKAVEAGSAYWCTCCLTGGRVTSVNGSYGDKEISYHVEIEGVSVECFPSDFVEYEVGDWVFVAKTGGECENTLRTEPCKGGCSEGSPEGGASYRIVPLRIGQDGV